MTTAIVVAAGKGERFGAPKQFLELAGRPIICWSIDALDLSSHVSRIVVAAPPEQVALTKELVGHHGKLAAVVPGGATRTESVRTALLASPDDTGFVLVHDAARPFVTQALIDRVIAALPDFDGVVPALPVIDTIKVVEEDLVVRTLERRALRAIQTPQGFSAQALRAAHERARKDGVSATDDAALLELMGYKVGVVAGDETNIKITYPDDLSAAEVIAAKKFHPQPFGEGA